MEGDRPGFLRYGTQSDLSANCRARRCTHRRPYLVTQGRTKYYAIDGARGIIQNFFR